jgi:hypothetical protein
MRSEPRRIEIFVDFDAVPARAVSLWQILLQKSVAGIGEQ